MGCLAWILSGAKVGETLKVYGRFAPCEQCSDLGREKATPICFSGRIAEGNVSASDSETFALSVRDDEGPERHGPFQMTVRTWSAAMSQLSFCAAAAESEQAASLRGATNRYFTLTVRRESLLYALWRQR
jgi:hypothetical protein